MSALEVYIYPFNTSGAIYIGEPSIVEAISLALFSVLQNPKSPNLRLPL
jgi:hypothetical protein